MTAIELPVQGTVTAPIDTPQVIRMPTAIPAASPLTPMAMLGQAVQSGQPMEVLEKLMGLQERWEANQARKAFNAAMAAAKAEIPIIIKDREVDFTSAKSRINYRYESLAAIMKVVDPILARHGLWARFKTRYEVGSPVIVTCVIGHRDGHCEENSLPGPKDETGNKNLNQQVASTVTYLQRYTLKAALGLAASDDDDGRSSGGDDGSLSPVEIDAKIADWTAKINAAANSADLHAIGRSLENEAPEVRQALRAPYTAARAKFRPKTPSPDEMAASGQPHAGNGDLPSAEIDALHAEVRRRLKECKSPEEREALWTELVEPVKNRLPDSDFNEIYGGFENAKG